MLSLENVLVYTLHVIVVFFSKIGSKFSPGLFFIKNSRIRICTSSSISHSPFIRKILRFCSVIGVVCWCCWCFVVVPNISLSVLCRSPSMIVSPWKQKSYEQCALPVCTTMNENFLSSVKTMLTVQFVNLLVNTFKPVHQEPFVLIAFNCLVHFFQMRSYASKEHSFQLIALSPFFIAIVA